MPTDTKVDNLVINLLSKAQYDSIQNPSETEIYLVPDVIDTAPTQGSSNPVESGGVYTSLSAKQNTIDSSHKLSADLVEDGTTNKVYTSTEQTKLSGIEAGAQVNVKPDWNATSGSASEILNKPTIPADQVNSDWNANSGVAQILNKPTLGTMAAESASDYTPTSDLATVATTGSYSDLSNKPTIPSAQVNTDWNSSSGVSQILNKPTLATVATSGSYNDLTNKPSIPAAQVNADWDATSGKAEILNKPTLAPVATSGQYSDLTGTPTIPAEQVNADWNATTGKAKILNKPTIPTATSDLNNDSGFITISDVPSQVNADWTAVSGAAQILNKPIIPAAQVNSDWNSSSGISQILNKPDIPTAMKMRIYRNLTGTAGKSSSPYRSSKWDVTDSTITAYEDGMVVSIIVPVAGIGTYGNVFQINDLGYKPVVYGLNSTIGTRYPLGGMIWMVYNADQTANWYNDSSTATTVTGCWQVMDYDSNTTAIYTLMYYRGTRICSGKLYRYVMSVFPDNTHILPLNSEGSNTTGSTATTKAMTTDAFDPLKGIVFYSTNAAIESGSTVAMSTMYYQTSSVDLRYSFNCGATSFVANEEIYLVMDLQSDGRLCKLASTPYSDTLPSTNDGHLYMLLGYTYSKYQMELYPDHPIYYHDGTSIKIWSGAPKVSGTNDGTNWTSLTIGNTTKAIPSGGGGGSSTLSGLTDTNLSSPTNDQMLKYNSTSQKWENANVPSEVMICTLTDNNGVYTCDKTIAEIIAANNSGGIVIMYMDAVIFGKWYFTLVVAGTYGTRSYVYFTVTQDSGGDTLGVNSVTGENTGDADSWSIRSRTITKVAFTANYNDLGNKPTIPPVDVGSFTHTSNHTVSTQESVFFPENQRTSVMMSTGADLDVIFGVFNNYDNYLWIKNTGSSDIDITIGGVYYNDIQTPLANVYMPTDGISVPAGKVCEISIVCNADGAFITSRSDLSL